jgi:chromosome partitioning protein
MPIIAIVNRKGGTAKTTTAVNLAHGLTLKLNGSGRVLLIDIDPQGNCAPALGVEANDRCISDLLTGRAELIDVIIPDLPVEEGGTGRPGLFLIPATDRLVGATEELLIRDFQNYRRRSDAPPLDNALAERIGEAVGAFDYILIDCPPSLGSLTDAVYHFADTAIVPVRAALLDAAGAAQHTRMINELQRDGLDITVSLILPTFFDSRQILAREVYAALIERYGPSRVGEPIPQSVLVQKGQAAGGQTVFEYAEAQGSPPERAYRQLVERIYNGR